MQFPPEEKPPKELRRTVHEITGYFIRTKDGDTLKCWIDKDFEDWTKITGRLARINCPETDPKLEKNPQLREIGEKAKARQAQLFEDCKWFYAQSHKPYINDPHNRYVLDIRLKGGKNLSDILLEERLALPYDGKSQAVKTDFSELLKFWYPNNG